MEYKSFKVTIQNKVANVAINRPEKANSLTMEAWEEMQLIFEELDKNKSVRAIILSGEGKYFCAGIDLSLLMSIQEYQQIDCAGRKREILRANVLKLQAHVNAIEKCSKPVLAAIHHGCIGGGVDIIAACDMRYSTADAYFTIKEIDMGMVADLGTLQRLPKIINSGIMAEMAFTGRKVYGLEAEKIGLVNSTFGTKEEMMDKVQEIAELIASKSPFSIRGTKHILLHARDHSVNDSLEYMATWNGGMFESNDLKEAFQATMEKRAPVFED